MLERGESRVALQNLAVALGVHRQVARAESLYRVQIADSLIAVARERLGAGPWIAERRFDALVDSGRVSEALRMLASARKAGDTRNPVWAVNWQAGAAAALGQYR